MIRIRGETLLVNFKFKRQVIGGGSLGFLVWVILIIADAIDELILDKGFFIGAYVFVFIPIIMSIYYSVHYIIYRPKFKTLLIWFGSYCAVFLLLWLIIFSLVNNDMLIIQKHSVGSIDLNGIEYMFYGLSVILFFFILCLIFHLVFAFVKRITKNKSN